MSSFEFAKFLRKSEWSLDQALEAEVYLRSLRDPGTMLKELRWLNDFGCPDQIFGQIFVRLLEEPEIDDIALDGESPIAWGEFANGDVHREMLAILTERAFSESLGSAWSVCCGRNTSVYTRVVMDAVVALAYLPGVPPDFVAKEMLRAMSTPDMRSQDRDRLRMAIGDALSQRQWRECYRAVWEAILPEKGPFYDTVAERLVEQLLRVEGAPSEFLFRYSSI